MPDSRRLIELAIRGLEAERERVDRELEELRGQASRSAGGRKVRITARRSKPRAALGSPQSRARKRRGMTRAQKQAVSERMKAYWAERRK